MTLIGYETTQQDNVFLFHSRGRKGIIVMAVKFTRLEKQIFNVSLGWYNKELKDFDYENLLGNEDGLKILQTVANCIVKFLKEHPRHSVHAEGNWLKKTLTYCRLIKKNIELIRTEYTVHALNSETKRWNNFEGECDKYIAFRVKSKIK